jgi:predicted ATP-dependent endonuclease of OLD family
MLITHVEVANFRKLRAVRIDLGQEKTLLVGANNSGKSSAMLALRRFLSPKQNTFRITDFTLSHLARIDELGRIWEANRNGAYAPTLDDWVPILPLLDLWISAGEGELHYLRDLIPNFQWAGGVVGMRFRLEPRDVKALLADFLTERSRVEALLAKAAGEAGARPLSLWPLSLSDYLSRRLGAQFTVRWYRLNPGLLTAPDPSTKLAQPQALSPSALPLESNPLSGLVRVHEISAQRGFGEASEGDGDDGSAGHGGNKLTEQLRAYYRRHLDPGDSPDESDLDALRAIEAAQAAFDDRLTTSFGPALREVETLGYPGAYDPRIRVSTRLGPVDGLNHETAVLFELECVGRGDGDPPLRLPESSNGLGYQNLISMIFRLMSFRDAWLRKNKAAKANPDEGIEPIHLVLIEEPEAHLHVQVQQVFIKHAYKILKQDPLLDEFPNLSSQLVVSSHSSHIAHEVKYDCLRYFRRLPAGMYGASVPTSTVSNLSRVFGNDDETQGFVTRYLRAQHADLFFADAIILVEGAAERMMLPHFIRRHFPFLDQCYITLLEIGGSHAHRLRPLVDALGLASLVITDLDAGKGKVAVAVERGQGQSSNNPTLRRWMLEKGKDARSVDALLDLGEADKVTEIDDLYALRIAYQTPLQVTLPKTGAQIEALPGTFEDALVLSNVDHFKIKRGKGLRRKFAEVLDNSDDAAALGRGLFDGLRTGDKAEFALGVLAEEDFDRIKAPDYILEGLRWLEDRLHRKKKELLLVVETAEQEGQDQVHGEEQGNA